MKEQTDKIFAINAVILEHFEVANKKTLLLPPNESKINNRVKLFWCDTIALKKRGELRYVHR